MRVPPPQGIIRELGIASATNRPVLLGVGLHKYAAGSELLFALLQWAGLGRCRFQGVVTAGAVAVSSRGLFERNLFALHDQKHFGTVGSQIQDDMYDEHP